MYSSSSSGPADPYFDDIDEMDDLSFTFAFQPIIDEGPNRVIGYEALIRGVAGQPASAVLSTIRPENRQRFDQAVRLRAIREASRLGLRAPLHLNCSWLSPAHTRAAMVGLLNAASARGIRREDLVLELQNLDQYNSMEELKQIRQGMRDFRVRLLVDRFGAGNADLARLAFLRPDMVKLDRQLIAGIQNGGARQGIVTGVVAMCRTLNIQVVAVGVEEFAELSWLTGQGVRLFQGYYFGKPAINRVPEVERFKFDRFLGDQETRGGAASFSAC